MSGGQYGGFGGFSGRSCGETWDKSWGGGNWMDRVGMGSLREKEEDTSESIDSTTVPDDAGDMSDVDDNKMEGLTAEERAKLAQTRAMRRRAITARFNKADTIRTGGRGATDYT